MSWEYWTPDEQEPSRDELKAEIEKLLRLLADERTESMKLRAALEQIAKWRGDDLVTDGRVIQMENIARAALEGRT